MPQTRLEIVPAPLKMFILNGQDNMYLIVINNNSSFVVKNVLH